jgi:hypothetical protein
MVYLDSRLISHGTQTPHTMSTVCHAQPCDLVWANYIQVHMSEHNKTLVANVALLWYKFVIGKK